MKHSLACLLFKTDLPRVLRFPVPLDKGNEGSGDKIGQESEGSGVENVRGADVLC